ncbi:hypothetical protein MMC26_002269 [Xylographa opegraphella]|nr:hypothetical protein [Xylographa opegraphella]
MNNIIVVLFALWVSIVFAVQPIEVQGSEFVNSVTNQRFQVIGVAYQPGGSAGYMPQTGVDPLSNGTTCLRDAALMQKLGLNTIRVYNLSPSINHDMCVSIFNDVGIYMFIDVNSPLPNESLNAGDPGSSYDATYLERIFGIVQAFKDYPNTLGFVAGNEDINDSPSAALDPPYLRAITRDLKNYISNHSNRTIPVGYSAADVRPFLVDSSSYMQCALNGSATDPSRIDFFGLNSYSFCGAPPATSFDQAGYNILISDFANTTVPVFFSEYGCNKVEPRVWDDTAALFSPPMTGVFSGGLAYEYTEGSNNFGLVNISANGSAQLRVDYDNLQAQLNLLNISLLESSNATATAVTPATCQSSLIGDSGVSNNFTIPPVPPGGQSLIDNGVTNITNGQLVPVSQLSVPMPVFDSNGVQLQGLAIKPIPNDQSNTPSGQNTTGTTPSGSSNTTGSAATPSATKSAGATMAVGGWLGWSLLALLMAWKL